jgi:hypothetical protein
MVEVHEFPRSKVLETNKSEVEELKATVAMLFRVCEDLDRGMKLMTKAVLADHDIRLRHLELELRKIQRKNMLVIVNPQSERAN